MAGLQCEILVNSQSRIVSRDLYLSVAVIITIDLQDYPASGGIGDAVNAISLPGTDNSVDIGGQPCNAGSSISRHCSLGGGKIVGNMGQCDITHIGKNNSPREILGSHSSHSYLRGNVKFLRLGRNSLLQLFEHDTGRCVVLDIRGLTRHIIALKVCKCKPEFEVAARGIVIDCVG